jgi:hypothetical protein
MPSRDPHYSCECHEREGNDFCGAAYCRRPGGVCENAVFMDTVTHYAHGKEDFKVVIDTLEKWTPLMLVMMLHYAIRTDPYAAHEPAHAGSIAVREQRAVLERRGMLERNLEGSFRATEKGRAFVDALCRTPEPISVTKWTVPAR